MTAILVHGTLHVSVDWNSTSVLSCFKSTNEIFSKVLHTSKSCHGDTIGPAWQFPISDFPQKWVELQRIRLNELWELNRHSV